MRQREDSVFISRTIILRIQAPTARRYPSPGQRPGSRTHQHTQGLKARFILSPWPNRFPIYSSTLFSVPKIAPRCLIPRSVQISTPISQPSYAASTANVFASAALSGMSIPKISKSKKWLTIIIKPAPEDPAGRFRAQDENVESVSSNSVSKK